MKTLRQFIPDSPNRIGVITDRRSPSVKGAAQFPRTETGMMLFSIKMAAVLLSAERYLASFTGAGRLMKGRLELIFQKQSRFPALRKIFGQLYAAEVRDGSRSAGHQKDRCQHASRRNFIFVKE